MPRYKKEKGKLLFKPKSYSGPHQDSQTAFFPKTVNGLNRLTNFGKSSILESRLCALNMPPLIIMSKTFFYQNSYN